MAAQRADHAPLPGSRRPGLRGGLRRTTPTPPAASSRSTSRRAPGTTRSRSRPSSASRRSVLGDLTFLDLRINDDDGRFIGVAAPVRTTLPESLLTRLGRGDQRLFERMDRVSEPGRRPAAILFADLEASGALSRRLSSRGYFDLIRDLTDLIDSSVIARDGIVGKHAGDGGSALFLAPTSTARSPPPRARRSRRPARSATAPTQPRPRGRRGQGQHRPALGRDADGRPGRHRGRLEVTALGDQMNEAARIEAAAKGGTILASKDLDRAARRRGRAGDRHRPRRDRLHAARRARRRQRQGDPRRRRDRRHADLSVPSPPDTREGREVSPRPLSFHVARSSRWRRS